MLALRTDSNAQIATTTPKSARSDLVCVRQTESNPYNAGVKKMFIGTQLSHIRQYSAIWHIDGTYI
jgi:hypothetical protein